MCMINCLLYRVTEEISGAHTDGHGSVTLHKAAKFHGRPKVGIKSQKGIKTIIKGVLQGSHHS